MVLKIKAFIISALLLITAGNLYAQTIKGKMVASTTVVDPDARAYLAAANILEGQIFTGNGTTEYPVNSERYITAVNNFFVSLKKAGLYHKIHYMYPLLGLTNANNLVNAISPGVKNLTPVAGFSAPLGLLGIYFDGSTIFKGTSPILLSEFGQYNISAAFYRNGGGNGYNMGVSDAGVTNYFGMSLGSSIFFKNGGITPPAISPNLNGLNLLNITASNRGTYYNRESQSLLTTSIGSATFSNEIWFGNINRNGDVNGASGGVCSLFLLGDGFTDSESLKLDTIVEKWAFDCRRAGGDLNFNTFSYFGDSITAGVGAAQQYHRWATALSYFNSATENNYGVGGATILYCDTTAIAQLIPKDTFHTRVFIAYSTNDYGMNVGFVPFVTHYTSVINKVLAKGYSTNDIVLITGFFNGTTDPTVASLSALQDQYIAKADSIGASFGISHRYNLKPYMIAHGGNSIITGIHPTNAGYDTIAKYLKTQLINY